MKSSEFVPTAWQSITNSCVLQIDVKYEDCDHYVYSAFYVDGERVGKVTKALVRYNSRGAGYFVKYKQRYYLSEFMRINLCS